MTQTEGLRQLFHQVITAFGAPGAAAREIEHAAWRADLLAFAAAGHTLSGATYHRTSTGVGPIGTATALGSLERAGDIARTPDGRWRAVRAAARGGLNGRDAESTAGYVRAAIGRMADWPVPRRIVESLAPGTAVPAAAVFLAEPRLTEADRAATARWMANRNAMGRTSTAPAG